MFFEIADADLQARVRLTSLPTSYIITSSEDVNVKSEYDLAGVVEFIVPPTQKLRMSRETVETSSIPQQDKPIGHYTAICPRGPGKWSEYDDLRDDVKQKSDTFLCCPALLVFRKKEEM